LKKNVFKTYRKLISLYKKQGKNDVNWFDISEKLNAIAIVSSDGIDIFSI